MQITRLFSRRYDPRISCVLDVLRIDPSRSTNRLANMLDMSTSHLQSLFKKNVGLRIGEVARELRLRKAKELLQQTHYSQRKIRETVGINDAANFSRAFKERFGLTPTQCRKKGCSSQKIIVFTNEVLLRR